MNEFWDMAGHRQFPVFFWGVLTISAKDETKGLKCWSIGALPGEFAYGDWGQSARTERQSESQHQSSNPILPGS